MRLPLLLVVLAAAAIAAGCGSSSPSGGATTAGSTVVGSRDVEGSAVLVDSSGNTLYTFAHGVQCTGECTDAWPPLLADGDVTAKDGSGLDATLLGTVKRDDGKLQVTYDDHPLYLYADDEPGESRGDGANAFGGSWDVARVSDNPFEREKTKGPSCEPDCGY
jgi:predicted lipoprotein with Yx(FWY)xxD motif